MLVAFGEAEAAPSDRAEAVHISRIQYTTGASDLLSVSQLQADPTDDPITAIQIRNAQRAKGIDLRLALGGGYDSGPEDLGERDGKSR